MFLNFFVSCCPITRMRHYALGLLVLLGAGSMVTGAAQDTRPKSQISIGLGKPRHPDMDIDKNGFMVSVNYRRKVGRFLNWGVVLLRASANSELDFFEDPWKLKNYLNKEEPFLGIGTTWSGIETYAAGAQLHLVLVNSRKHLCSLSGGVGVYRSTSTSQGLGMVSWETFYNRAGEPLDSRITRLEGVLSKATKTEPFFLPALYYQYTPGVNFFVGIEALALLDLDSEPLTKHPVLANFYSFNLHVGYHF